MSTIIENAFSINGVIDTSKSVTDNITTLANACGSWVTFDIHTGLWSVVINQSAQSSASFNDSNIIGGITVSGTGLTELYNKVEIEFPHADLNDQVDYITYSIPAENRFENERDNTLKIKYDCLNNPTQAEYLARLELLQSRIDKVIQFKTDFSMLGVVAGDVIDVTNDALGYDSKLFRVLTVVEEDTDDNLITLSITAFEYSEEIYPGGNNLVREVRTTKNSIISDCVNDTVQTSNSQQTANSLWPMLAATAATGLFNLLFSKNPITGKIEALLKPKDGISDELITAMATPNIGALGGSAGVCAGGTATVTATMCVPGCADVSSVKLPYEITGVTTSDITIPLKGTVPVSGTGGASLAIPTQGSAAANGDKTMTVKIGTQTKTVVIHPQRGYLVSADPSTITEGGSTTVTFTTTGIPDNTVLNFKVSGSLDHLSNIQETGSVTIVGGTGSINVVTKNLSSIENASITIEADPDQFFYCSGEGATITLTHTGTPPEPPPPTYPCEWVSVPTAWCGTFDDAGNAVTVFPVGTLQVLKAIDGQPKITVPLTATVSGTTITPATTIDIDASSSVGGIVAKVITSFNAITPGVKRITGTTTQVIGRT